MVEWDIGFSASGSGVCYAAASGAGAGRRDWVFGELYDDSQAPEGVMGDYRLGVEACGD